MYCRSQSRINLLITAPNGFKLPRSFILPVVKTCKRISGNLSADTNMFLEMSK